MTSGIGNLIDILADGSYQRGLEDGEAKARNDATVWRGRYELLREAVEAFRADYDAQDTRRGVANAASRGSRAMGELLDGFDADDTETVA